MRRLACWTLNAVTVLSLLLCVATVSEFVRSFFAADTITRVGADSRSVQFITSERGALAYLRVTSLGRTRYRRPASQFLSQTPKAYYPRELSSADLHRFAGFAWGAVEGPGARLRTVVVPLPACALALGLLPTLRLRATLRQRRLSRSNCCPRCSYDLTGNVSGVCPECGTKVDPTHG